MGIRWNLVYPLFTRHVEALLQERSLNVNHLVIYRISLPGDGVAEFTDTPGFAIKPPTPGTRPFY